MTRAYLEGWIIWLMWRKVVHEEIGDMEAAERLLTTADHYAKLLAEQIGWWDEDRKI